MVVHLKKRNNHNTDGNLYKSCLDKEKNKSENKLIRPKYPKIYMKNNKANKSIQNIFYNTFFNCLFNNEQNSNSINKNLYKNNININNNNNIFEQKNYILANKKEFKSISSEKNIFKYKKLFELKTNKKEYENNLNKIHDLVNYSTERKRGKIFIHPPREEKNVNEKDKFNYFYLNYKNHLIKSSKINFPPNKKEIIA